MTIEVIEIKQIECEFGQVSKSMVQLDNPIDKSNFFIGIDPGSRHMGMTMLFQKYALCFELLMPQETDPIQSMHNVRKIMEWILDVDEVSHNTSYAVVEGGSHGERFGQVRLAEARAIAMLTLDKYGVKVAVVPPRSIRKIAFGDGNTRAEEIWKKLLPPNAASSLACAFCATKKF